MKVSIESNNRKVTIEQDNIRGLPEAIEICLKCLIGITYHPESIEDVILDMAEEIKEKS